VHKDYRSCPEGFARAPATLRSGLPFICLLACLTLLAPPSCFAALGGDLNSVLGDQIQFQGSEKVTQMASFEIHEIRPQTGATTGTVIREYVSPAGTVFAVTWQGEWLPNMRQLLGTYFQQFTDAVKQQSTVRPGRKPLHIARPDFVLHMTGHMRSYSGKAYLPAMLPPGVQPEAIQ
jgi:hypothetical protein